MSRIHDLNQYGQIVNARWLPVKLCKPSPFQARADLGEQEMEELTKSIKAHGIEVPGLVRPIRSGFEVVDGHRRHEAARRLSIELWPVMVSELDDSAAAEQGWRANTERKSYTDWEEAHGVDMLARLWSKEMDSELSESQIARRLNRSRTYVSNAYEVLGLPKPLLEVAKSVNGAKSSLLLVAKNVLPEDQREFAEKIQTERPSFKQVEKMVSAYADRREHQKQSQRPDSHTRKALSAATAPQREAKKMVHDLLPAAETGTREVTSWIEALSPADYADYQQRLEVIKRRVAKW